MQNRSRHFIAFLTAGSLAISCGSHPTANPTTPTVSLDSNGEPVAHPSTHDWTMKVVQPVSIGMTVEGVSRLCDDNLALAKQLIAKIKKLKPQASAALTFANTLGRLDDAFLAISNGSDFPYLMGVSHPSEGVRQAAQQCEKKTDSMITSLWLDNDLYRVIQAYAETKPQLAEEEARFLAHTLRDFRRNGIALDKNKQKRLREINKEGTEIGQRFIAAISSSKGSIRVPASSLKGLPDRYRQNHPLDKEGMATITTDYPDYFPFVTYSSDRKAAAKLFVQFANRGGNDNVSRLERLLSLRHEKAQLLGYANWADYAIEPRMAGKAATAISFLERVADAIRDAARIEYQEFSELYSKLQGTKRPKLLPADRYYLTDRVRNLKYKLDSKKLAEYFEVDAVTEGLLGLTAQMYGLTYKAVPAKAWHPSVSAYEVWSDGQRIGKFYLDLAPREHKYKHAAMFTIRTAKPLGRGVVQTPIAALVCNFPPSGEPMPHEQVVTYFHEFGHVLHHLLTKTKLASFAGTNTARDFVEAPSQMFEEWAWSREVLQRFAKHRESGELLPDALLKTMVQSRRVGLALSTQRQLFLASLDLGYHTHAPGFDSTALLKEIHNKNFLFPYQKSTHFQSSFGHLIGYDAAYYGYQWALSLAHDVLSRFKKEGLLNPAVAEDWRETILSQGGGRDERTMVRDFLGRMPSEKAYTDFLRGKE